MPRYYFNLANRHAILADREGVELVGDFGLLTASIIAEIVGRMVDQIRSEEPALHDIDDGWWIEVVNHEGLKLAAFPVPRSSAAH